MAWFIRLAARVGPKAVLAAKNAAPYLMADAETRKRLLALLEGLPRTVSGLPLTRERRLSRRIERVQVVARDVLESAADPRTKEQANDWLARADKLQSSLAAARASKRSQRKKRLDQIAGALDALIADMIDSGLGGPGGPGNDL